MNKKNILLFGMVFISLLFVSLVPAAENVCCEETNTGALCVNVDINQCLPDSKAAPTSCEATSYCKLGTCINTREGLCMENTPEIACDPEQGGVWIDDKPEDIPQCGLGCCLIGDQAAFTTKTRCKSLSSLYGLEISYREDMTNEFECIASARSDIEGACVFERDLQKTCRFTTQKECSDMSTEENSAEFHAGLLCTNFELDTNCEKSKKTTCIEGEDEVFFLDTCGNLANIYDGSRAEDQTYWNSITQKSGSCGAGGSNAESVACGNCDYYLGSTCSTHDRSKGKGPTYGENICIDLGCEYEGQTYSHGETWCADSKGTSTIIAGRITNTDSSKQNLPGSEYARLVCYNGDVSVEPCATWRAEVCIEASTSTGFSAAACRVNRWQDCIDQTTELDCINTDKRDCKWEEVDYCQDTDEVDDKEKECKKRIKDDTLGLIVFDDDTETYGACLPRYSPGFDVWNTESEADSICSSANTQCIKTTVKGTSGTKRTENKYCGSNDWESDMQNICSSLGDCGSTENYFGTESYKDWDSAFVKNDGDEEEESE